MSTRRKTLSRGPQFGEGVRYMRDLMRRWARRNVWASCPEGQTKFLAYLDGQARRMDRRPGGAGK